ncbi:aminomethyl-transferring glycine dehydrogenase subunit GcvPA [bacterium]|nr:aminomethyl-transferring glycine dehydrogenase subunit GcvPA [bacterium]
MAYVPHTEAQFAEMLEAIGVSKFEDLIAAIPDDVRLQDGLNLPDGLSEFEVAREMRNIGAKNRNAVEGLSFLGGGSYDHFIPAGVGAILSRSEWYTAYTPYQPEVAQGTLQAIYEFQSVICDITGMDVANASIYDGATAMTEAMLLALRSQRKRSRVLVSDAVHPHYLKLLLTYARTSNIDIQPIPMVDGRTDISALKNALNEDVAVVMFAQPNFFGILEDAPEIVKLAHEAGALAAVSAYPVSLGMLASPGEYDADIVTGEGQCLGNRVAFGGPYLGLFAAKEKLIRQMPGRISGQTVDKHGRRGFVLTLQTREQHIRRGKATSNICTNQGLNALAALVHIALLGKEGFRKVSEMCYHKAHYLQEKICELDGFRLLYNQPFFNEFVIETAVPAKELVEKMGKRGIFPGIRLGRFYPEFEHALLVAVTEKRTREDMDLLVEELSNL